MTQQLAILKHAEGFIENEYGSYMLDNVMLNEALAEVEAFIKRNGMNGYPMSSVIEQVNWFALIGDMEAKALIHAYKQETGE